MERGGVPGVVVGDQETHLTNVEKRENAEKNEKNEQVFQLCAPQKSELAPQTIERAEEIRQRERCGEENEKDRKKKSGSENPVAKPGRRGRLETTLDCWGQWGQWGGQRGCHV